MQRGFVTFPRWYVSCVRAQGVGRGCTSERELSPQRRKSPRRQSPAARAGES